MALIDSPAAGRYSGTFNSVDVGVTEDGYELEMGSSAEMIERTDAFGGAAIDAIYRGGNAFLAYTSLAYKAGSITPFWPWAGGTLGKMADATYVIGRLASDVASAMVLTVVTATPADATGPDTLTASKAILAPNSPNRIQFTSMLRKVPTRLQLFPYASSANFLWFSTT